MASVSLLALGAQDFALAKPGQGRDGLVGGGIPGRMRIESKLTSSTPGVEGHARWEMRQDRERFQGRVEIPLPSSLISGDPDETVVTMHLLRGGQEYATCSLVLDEPDPLVAQYNVTIGKRGDTVVAKHGQCDVDLNMVDVQPGLPAVQDGDTTSIDVGTTANVLSGTFSKKR
jgi:hypothetical protein